MQTSDLEFFRFLGEGTNGQVYLALEKVTQTRAVLKAVFERGGMSKEVEVVTRETGVNVKLGDSPWFVKTLAVWHDKKQFYIIMVVSPGSPRIVLC